MLKRNRSATILLLCLFGASPLRAQDILYPKQPVWEIGINMGSFYLPDYPGSDQSHLRFLPLPYLVYRGEFLRSDQTGGLHGLFLNNGLIDIDISADTAFPVESGNNTARANMPSLDWMFEIGPRLIVHVLKSTDAKIDLGFAFRAVDSIDLTRIDSRGFDFYPTLKYERRLPLPRPAFVAVVFGGIWATDKLTQYFYEVPPENAAANRPPYEARPGFLAESLSVVYVQPVSTDWSVYIGAVKNYYSESANRASPLLLDIETESYFVGIYWSALKSEKKVATVD